MTRVTAGAALTLFAVIGLLLSQQPLGQALAGTVTALVVAVLLAWRDSDGWVLAGGLSVVAAGLTLACQGQAANLGWFGFCVASAWCGFVARPRQTTVLTVGLVLVLAAQFVQDPNEPGWGAWVSGTVFTAVACTLARRQVDLVEQLRAAQAGLTDRTRAEERNRIAAEMHDVIGHALTVSLLHVTTARLAIEEGATDEALAALEQAETQSRRSLEEVRATVGMMRAGGYRTAPLPGAADLAELVESFRRAGTPVTCELHGDLDTLPASIGLAAYRIVQEALTNVVRHAAGSATEVRVDVTDHEATVVVASTGAPGRHSASGTGLLGMRERAEAVGGRLTAAPHEAGWRVEAVLPA